MIRTWNNRESELHTNSTLAYRDSFCYCCFISSGSHDALMRFANFANASIPTESENFLGNDWGNWRRSFGSDPDSACARVQAHLFVVDYKHSESKGKRATKTEKRYLLLLRWISFHGILSNSIQSPPLRKALSVSSLSAALSLSRTVSPSLLSPPLPRLTLAQTIDLFHSLRLL